MGGVIGVEQNAGLRRVLGPVDATCVVVGAIIGVGIFFTPSRVADLAGSGGLAMAAWAAGGAIALLGALTFAELGGLYPRTGGQYEVLRDAYGALPAFLFVFCNATAIQAGATAIIAIVCAQNLGIAAGVSLEPVPLAVVASMLIVGLIIANGVGVRWGAGIQNLTVLAKVATLVAVTVIAMLFGSASVTGPGPAEASGAVRLGIFGALFAALVPTLFSFGGWQHALWMAGEVRRPRRDVPLAIILGVVVVVTVYLSVNWAYLKLLGYDGVAASETIAADSVAVVWPGAGERVVAAAVAVSAFGVLNAQLLSGPRLLYGMALDGRFFRPFAGVHATFRTPVPAILLIGGLALVLLVAAGPRAIDRLLTGVVFVDGVFFALTGMALVVLRRRKADADRPVRVPAYPFVPLLFVVGEIAVIIGAALDPSVRGAAYVGAAWIVAGTICYLLFFRCRRTVP
jgi:APA family basic amino acid/polyamine antiporter